LSRPSRSKKTRDRQEWAIIYLAHRGWMIRNRGITRAYFGFRFPGCFFGLSFCRVVSMCDFGTLTIALMARSNAEMEAGFGWMDFDMMSFQLAASGFFITKWAEGSRSMSSR
jgi:hypothetical protein